MTLEATRDAPVRDRQRGFADEEGAVYDPGPLADRLSNRLRAEAVQMLAPRASHIPERSEVRLAALAAPLPRGGAPSPRYEPPWPYGTGLSGQPLGRQGPRRPAFLLERPELISVVAEVPDGPPARFTWRRVERRVARAEGPERIAPEWWRSIGASAETKRPRPRDYYRVEDETGDAFWVFRHGFYGGEEDGAQAEGDFAPRWFLHGIYA